MYVLRCDAPDCTTETPTTDPNYSETLPDGWIETSQEHEHQFCSWDCVHAFCAPLGGVDDMDADALEALAADAIEAANTLRGVK